MTSLRQSIPRGDFTPIKDLEISDLPRGWQCQESLDVISHVAQRVVMIYIPRMSSERPASIYSDRPHYGGTGFAYYVDQHVVKIRTNLHLLYNAEETSTAVVQFSLHVPGKRNTRVVRLQASSSHFHTTTQEDFSTFTCPTSRYLAKYLHVFYDVPVFLDEGLLSEKRTLVAGDCCGQGDADEKDFKAGVKSQSAKDNEVAGDISVALDEGHLSEETTVVDGDCCGQGDADEKDFEAGVKSQSANDNKTAGGIAAVEHRVEKSNADDSAVSQYLKNRATSAGFMCQEASGKDAGNDSTFYGEEVNLYARLEGGEFFVDAAEPFPVTFNKHDQSKETCQLSGTKLRGDLQTNTRTDGRQTELQIGEFKDVSQSKLGNSFDKKTSQIPDTVCPCRRPALEKGDFVAILSHPQGAEKCFSIGPAAVQDLPSVNAQQTCHHNRSSHDDLQSSQATVDLVSDRFRSCTNRVYHTHTTFGCSGAPVLLFKRSLQHLKIPVLDFSQHSGTCFFKDGGNLGFATCFTPPVFNKSDRVHTGLQQCYSVNQREQQVFENIEKRAETESEGMSVDPQSTQTVLYCNSKPGIQDFDNLDASQRSCVTSGDNLDPSVQNIPQSTIASSTDLTPGWLHLSKLSSQNLTSLEVNVQTVTEDAAQTVSAERSEETQPNTCSSVMDSGFGSEHFSHSDNSLTSQHACNDESARDYAVALKSVRHHFQAATKSPDSVNSCSSALTQHSAKRTEALTGLSVSVSWREVKEDLVKVALRSPAPAHDSTDRDKSSSIFSLDDGGWPALVQVSRKKSLISPTRRGVGKRRKSSSKGHLGRASKSPLSFTVRKKNICTWKVKRSKPLSHSSLKKHLRSKLSEKISSDSFQNDKADGESSDFGTDKGALTPTKTNHPVAEPEPASHQGNKQDNETSQALLMTTDSVMDTISVSAPTTEDVVNAEQTFNTPERMSDESSTPGSISKLTESSQSNVKDLVQTRAFVTEKTPSPRKRSLKMSDESIYSYSEISESVSCAERNHGLELEHPSQNYAEQFECDDRGNSNVQGIHHPLSRQTKEEEGVFEYTPEHFDATLHEFFSSENRASEVFEDWSDFASTEESTSSVIQNAGLTKEECKDVAQKNSETADTDMTQTQDNQPRRMQELPEIVQIYRDSDFDSLGDTLPAPRNSYTLQQLKILKNQQKKLMRKTERSASTVMNGPDSVVDQQSLDKKSYANHQSLGKKSYANHHGKNIKAMVGFQNAAPRFPDTVTQACKDQHVYRVENYCSEKEKDWLGPRSQATATQLKQKQTEVERYQNHQDRASLEQMRHSEEYGRDPRSIDRNSHPLSSGECARLAADMRALHQIHQQQLRHDAQHRGSCQAQEQPWSFFSQPDNAVCSVESVQRHPQTVEHSDICTCREYAFGANGPNNSRDQLNLQQRRYERHTPAGHDYFPDFPVRPTPSSLHTHFSAGFEQQDPAKQRLYQHVEDGHGKQARMAMTAQNRKQNWRSTNSLYPVDNIGCRPSHARESSWPPVNRTAETVDAAPCRCRTEVWPFSSSCYTTDPQAATNTDDMHAYQDAGVQQSHELLPPPVKKYAFHPSLRHGHEKYPSHQCTITRRHHNAEELPEVSHNHRRGMFRDELWPPQMPAAERSLHSRDQAATTNASNPGYFQGTQVSSQADAANRLNLYQPYPGTAEQGRPLHGYDPSRPTPREPASGQCHDVPNTTRATDSFPLYHDASRFAVSAPDRRLVLRAHETADSRAGSRRDLDASMSTDELYCRSASQPHERYRRMMESQQAPAERPQLSKDALYCHDPWNVCGNNSERSGRMSATTIESHTQKLRPSSRMMTTPPYTVPPSHPALLRPAERRPEDPHNRDDHIDFVYARHRRTDTTHPQNALDHTVHMSRSGGHVLSLSSAFERFLCSAQDDEPDMPTDRPQWGRKSFDTCTKTTRRSTQEAQFNGDPIPGYHPGGEPRSFHPRGPRDSGSYRTHDSNEGGTTDAVSNVGGLTFSGQQQRRGVERQHPYLQRPAASTLSSTFERFLNTTQEERLKSSATKAAPFHSSHIQHGYSTAYVPWSHASDDFASEAEADMFDLNSVVRVVLEMGVVNPAGFSAQDMPSTPRRVQQSSSETYSTQLSARSARYHQLQSNGREERTQQYNEPDYVDMNNPALRYPRSSAQANNSLLIPLYVNTTDQTIYEPTPKPRSTSASFYTGHDVRYSSHNLLPPPLPDGRHHVSHSLGYHSLVESNHETFAAHGSSGTFAPDPNWIFTGQIPSFAQNDRTLLTTNTSRGQPGHQGQRDSRQRSHCRLSCLCAGTPSTTNSPYDQAHNVFTFPDVTYADPRQQNGNGSYSCYHRTQAVSYDSVWTHTAPHNTVHNPLYQSEYVPRTHYYQNAPQACFYQPPYKPHSCDAQCCMNQCTKSSASLYRQPPPLFLQPASRPRPSRDARQFSTLNASQDARQFSTLNPSQDARQFSTLNPSQDARQPSTLNPSQDARQFSTLNPSQDARQFSTLNPSQDARQSSTLNPSQDARQPSTLNPSQDARQFSTLNPSQDARQFSTLNPSQDARQPSTLNPSQDAHQFSTLNPSQDARQFSTLNASQDARQSSTLNPSQDARQPSTLNPSQDAHQFSTLNPSQDARQFSTLNASQDARQSFTLNPSQDARQPSTLNPSQDARQFSTLNPSQDARQFSTLNPLQDARQFSTLNPSQDARQPSTLNPSQDARQFSTLNPSQDARQFSTLNPSQDARQFSTLNPSQDARQSSTLNPSQDARQFSTLNPSQDARQFSTLNPSQDARQFSTLNPSQDARQFSTLNPSQDARQPSTLNPSQDARQPSTLNASQDARQSSTWNPPPTRDPPRQEPVKSSNATRDPPREEPVKSSNATRDPPRQGSVKSSDATRDPPRQGSVKSSNATRDPPRQGSVKSSDATRDPPRQGSVKSSNATRDPPRQKPVKSSDEACDSYSWRDKACVPTYDVLDTSFMATLQDLDIIQRHQSDRQSSCKGSPTEGTDNESSAGARADISDYQKGDDNAGSGGSSSLKRGIYIKNTKKPKAEKSRYVRKKKRSQLDELKASLRRYQKKKNQGSNKGTATTNSSTSSSTGESGKESSSSRRKRQTADDSEKESSRIRHSNKQIADDSEKESSRTRHSNKQIADDSNSDSADREVCYITSSSRRKRQTADDSKKESSRTRHSNKQIADDSTKESSRKRHSNKQIADDSTKESSRTRHSNKQIADDSTKESSRTRHSNKQIADDSTKESSRKRHSNKQIADDSTKESSRKRHSNKQIADDSTKESSRTRHSNKQIADDSTKESSRKRHSNKQIADDSTKESSRKRHSNKQIADDSTKESSRTHHSNKQIADDSNSDNADVCYITVPIDIRMRLEKVSKWVTTQVFGFPWVHYLTPRDAATFKIQQNFNLTIQLMALKAGDEKAMLVS